MKAAIDALRDMAVRRLVVAVPIAPPDTAQTLQGMADELVCLATPPAFRAVGQFYLDFEQTTDEEVIALLDRASAFGVEPATRPASSARE
jgi:putative phosphoribosyl transferase